ncbi:MAG TPA: C40 family peptidase [Pyrinomonadaceae bacterium]
MSFRKLFPYALALCFALSITENSLAQTEDTRPRNLTQTTASLVLSPLDAEEVIISLASEEDIKRANATSTTSGRLEFRQLMTAAIDQRLGTRYLWGGTGLSGMDCSGFVWSTFRSAGIEFERSSARTLWGRFAEPTAEEKYKFGTLVFFSNLTHIGIVADEHGFYHASRRHGVVYSPFSDYWVSRIDGFRRVPVPEQIAAD